LTGVQVLIDEQQFPSIDTVNTKGAVKAHNALILGMCMLILLGTIANGLQALLLLATILAPS